MNLFWQFAYLVYPPFLRVLEKIQIHSSRQEFLLGKLNLKFTVRDLKDHLEKLGFEKAILAWRDPGEILSMRRLHEKVFQHHIRLFSDGEIRCHFEYASEANPWGHVREKNFKSDEEFFIKLLGDFLVAST